MRNGLKIRFSKGSAGSSPAARTKCLLAQLLTDEDQERSTSNAQGEVVAASMRATFEPSGKVSGVSDQKDIGRFMQRRASFKPSLGEGDPRWLQWRTNCNHVTSFPLGHKRTVAFFCKLQTNMQANGVFAAAQTTFAVFPIEHNGPVAALVRQQYFTHCRSAQWPPVPSKP